MMIVEQVLTALLLIIDKGVGYLLLHVYRCVDFVFTITLNMMTTIVLELRILKFY